MTIQLFECQPLNASISSKQCEANKKRMFACETCQGLGMPVTIDQPTKPKETHNMARPAIKPIPGLKKGDRFTCPDCNKDRAYESNGVCKQCRAKQKSGAKNSQALQKMPLPAQVMEPVEVAEEMPVDDLPAEFGKVENAAGDKVAFGVDPLILANIRRTLAELEQHMVVDLSGVPYFEALDYLQDIRRGMARQVAV